MGIMRMYCACNTAQRQAADLALSAKVVSFLQIHTIRNEKMHRKPNSTMQISINIISVADLQAFAPFEQKPKKSDFRKRSVIQKVRKIFGYVVHFLCK